MSETRQVLMAAESLPHNTKLNNFGNTDNKKPLDVTH